MRRILGVRQGRVRGPVTGFLPGQDCSHAQKHRTSRACGILKRPSAPAGHFARPHTNPSCGARCAFLVRVDLARTRVLLAPVCNCPAKQSGADLPSVLVYPIPRRLRHFSFTRMQCNCPRGRCQFFWRSGSRALRTSGEVLRTELIRDSASQVRIPWCQERARPGYSLSWVGDHHCALPDPVQCFIDVPNYCPPALPPVASHGVQQ